MSASCSQDKPNDCLGFGTKKELVLFNNVLPQYSTQNDVTIQYTLGPHVTATPLDWIGIFRSVWPEISKPLTFQWAPIHSAYETAAGERSATFPRKLIQPLEHPKETYQFMYINNHSQVIGISRPFFVKESQKEIPLSLAQSKSRVIESTNGDARSGNSDSAVLLTSEDELDFHTNSIRQKSSSSYCDLSDLIILSTSPSMEMAEPMLDDNNIDVRTNKAFQVDGTVTNCNTDDSGGKSSNDQQQEDKLGGVFEQKTLLDERDTSKSKDTFPGYRLSVIPMEGDKTSLTCAKGDTKPEITKMQKRNAESMITAIKKSQKKPVEDGLKNHFPISSTLLKQLTIVHIENSSDDEEEIQLPYEFQLCKNEIQTISDITENKLSVLVAVPKGRKCDVCKLSKNAEVKHLSRIQFEKSKEGTDEDDKEHKLIYLVNAATGKMVKAGGDFWTLPQEGVLDKTHEDAQVLQPETPDDDTLKDTQNIPSYDMASTVHQHFMDVLLKGKQKIAEAVWPTVNITDKTIKVLEKEQDKSLKENVHVTECQHKECSFKHELPSSGSSVDILSDVMCSGSQVCRGTMAELKTTRKKRVHGQRARVKKKKRLQPKQVAKTHRKPALLFDYCGDLEVPEHGADTSCSQKQEVLNSLLHDTSEYPPLTSISQPRGSIGRAQTQVQTDHVAGSTSDSSPGDDSIEATANGSSASSCMWVATTSLLQSCQGATDTENMLTKSEETTIESALADSSIEEADVTKTIGPAPEIMSRIPAFSAAENGWECPSRCQYDLLHEKMVATNRGVDTDCTACWPGRHVTYASLVREDADVCQRTSQENILSVLDDISTCADSSQSVDSTSNMAPLPVSHSCCNNEQHIQRTVNTHIVDMKVMEENAKPSDQSQETSAITRKRNTNLQLPEPHSREEVEDCFLAEQVTSCKQSEDRGITVGKVILCSLTAPRLSECTGPLSTRCRTDHSTQYCQDNTSIIPEPAESNKTIHDFCTGRLTNVLDTVHEASKSNLCLTWPLPSFISTVSAFGPWITQHDCNDQSHGDTISDCLHTEKSLHSKPPPRLCSNTVRTSYKKLTTSTKTDVKNYEDVSEETNTLTTQVQRERAIVLGRALMLSLAENIELKQRLGILEDQLDETKLEYQQKQEQETQATMEVNTKENKHNVKDVRHRRVPVLPSSGGVKNMIRMCSEISSLRSKVKGQDIEIKDLTTLISTLKVTLHEETRKALKAHTKCLKLKEKVKEQKAKLKAREFNASLQQVKTDDEFQASNQTRDCGEPDEFEPPTKKRRIMKEITDDVKEMSESAVQAIASDDSEELFNQVLNFSRTTPATSFDDEMRTRYVDAAESPIKLSDACSVCCTDISPVYHMTELSNPCKETRYPASINTWASSFQGPSITSCHPHAVSSYLHPPGAVDSTHPCKLPSSLAMRQRESHLAADCTRHHKLMNGHESVPYHNFPTSSIPESTVCTFVQNHMLEQPSIREHLYPLDCRVSQVTSQEQLCTNSQRCSASYHQLLHMEQSLLSCNKSRNKSKESPLPCSQDEISRRTHNLRPVAAVRSRPASLDIQTLPRLSVTEDISEAARNDFPPQHCSSRCPNFAFHSHDYRDRYEQSDNERSVTCNIDDSNLYWPSKHVNDTQKCLQTTHGCIRTLRSPAITNDAGSKVKGRVAPFHISRKSPDKAMPFKRNVFAFASGATVCSGSSNGDLVSDRLSRWLKPSGDDECSNSPGMFETPHLLSQGGQWSAMNKITNCHIPCSHQVEKKHESPYSHFQSCFLRQLVKDESHKHQQLRSHNDQHATINRANHQLQHRQVQPFLPPQQMYSSQLAFPPSELPFPPLSPFHTPEMQFRETTTFRQHQREPDHIVDTDNLNQFLPESVPRNALYGDHRPNLQPSGQLTLKQCTQASLHDVGDNYSTGFQNPESLLDLSLHGLRAIPRENTDPTSGSHVHSTVDIRQIEASATCHRTRQR